MRYPYSIRWKLGYYIKSQGFCRNPNWQKAIKYCLNLWPALKHYVEADFLEPDNNEVERIVRIAALGMKNYPMAGSERGGEAIATFYSLAESAKAHQLNVLHYLTDVLERLPYCKTIEDYRALTPNRWKPANLLN